MRQLRKFEIEVEEEHVYLANIASPRNNKKETKNEQLNTNEEDEVVNDAKVKTKTKRMIPRNL